jgi:hypothetical protein
VNVGWDRRNPRDSRDCKQTEEDEARGSARPAMLVRHTGLIGTAPKRAQDSGLTAQGSRLRAQDSGLSDRSSVGSARHHRY